MRTRVILFQLIFSSLTLTCTAQDWQWMKQIGGHGNDFVRLHAEDEEGNIYALVHYAADTPGNPNPIQYNNCYIDGDTIQGRADAILAKYDTDGNLIWLKNCVSPSGSIGFTDLVVDTISQSLYAIGAYEVSCMLDTIIISAGTSAGALLSRWNYDGSCLWVRNVATSGTDQYGNRCSAHSLVLMPNGEVLVSGLTTRYTQTFVQGDLFEFGSFLTAYHTDGSSLWARQFISQNSGASPLPLDVTGRGAMLYACAAYGMNSPADTVTLDTLIMVGGSLPVQGYLLARISPVDGSLIWVSKEGIGTTIWETLEPLATDTSGLISIVGLFNDTAIFSIDTLTGSNNSVWSSFLAVHDTSGEVLSVQSYQSSGGVMVENIVSDPLGGYYASGIVMTGAGSWDGIPYQVTDQSIFVSKHAADGTCQGIFTDGNGTGALNTSSILATTNGLYLGLYFPGDAATGTVTLGDSSFTTYGYRDALLAKLGLITSVQSYSTEVQDDLLIYANPNNGLCTVELPQHLRFTPNLNLVIFDAQGRQVQRIPVTTGSDGVRLDITAQAKGMYHVELSDGTQRYSGRIVFE